MEASTKVEMEVIDMDCVCEEEKEVYIVGRLVSEENLNPSILIEATKNAWKPKHVMSWRELGESKLTLFCFDNSMDRDCVLKHQPWIFEGTLFTIKKFEEGDEQLNVSIEHASFWARLYDVPFSCMNERSLRLFAKQIGILESVDKLDEDLIGKFMRFKISLNITKPLLREINIRVKGEQLWLPLMYESLPNNYCFSCGTIDHYHKNCLSFDSNLKFSSCIVEQLRYHMKL